MRVCECVSIGASRTSITPFPQQLHSLTHTLIHTHTSKHTVKWSTQLTVMSSFILGSFSRFISTFNMKFYSLFNCHTRTHAPRICVCMRLYMSRSCNMTNQQYYSSLFVLVRFAIKWCTSILSFIFIACIYLLFAALPLYCVIQYKLYIYNFSSRKYSE